MSTEVILTSLPEEVNPKGTDLTYIVDTVNNLSKFSKLENLPISTATQTTLNLKQNTLVSGTNIKTINSTSLLGSGDVAVQETLVSGTNIKTLNNESLLGSGNIEITASPSGVAGAIQFSDGSAFASDAANLFWDDTNNRLGIGTNNPSRTLTVTGDGARIKDLNIGVSSSTSIGNTSNMIANFSSNGIGVKSGGVLNASAIFHIQGSGSTSATTSLLVENSVGTQLFKVTDEGGVNINATLKIANQGALDRGYANGTGTRYGYAGGIQNHVFYTNSGSQRMIINNDGKVGIGTDTPSSSLEVSIPTTGTILTLNNLATPTQIFKISKPFSALNLFDIGTTATNFKIFDSYVRISVGAATTNFSISNNGNIGIGIAENSAVARVDIKGSGTTQATSSLLVQNSAGTELAKFNDDGSISFGSKISISNIGTINTNGNVYALGGSSVQVASTGNFRFVLASQIWSDSDGIVRLGNWANNGFTMLRLGGQTASFPSLKRNGTAIDVRLADDSNYAQFNTGATLIKGSGNTSATTSLLVQNSDGTQLFKINDNRDVFLGSSTNYIHQGVFFQGDYHGVGNWNFGTASNLGARLGIKGSGATSATTALLVQNSAGTEAFKVNDAGDLFFNGLETSSMRIHTLGNTNKGISIDNEMDMGAFYGITFKTWDGSAYSNFMRINGNTASRGLIIGGTTNDASAKLQIDSTTQGFLPPRMTQAEILAIAAPATGLMAYNLDIGQVCVFDGAIWHKLSQSHM